MKNIYCITKKDGAVSEINVERFLILSGVTVERDFHFVGFNKMKALLKNGTAETEDHFFSICPFAIDFYKTFIAKPENQKFLTAPEPGNMGAMGKNFTEADYYELKKYFNP